MVQACNLNEDEIYNLALNLETLSTAIFYGDWKNPNLEWTIDDICKYAKKMEDAKCTVGYSLPTKVCMDLKKAIEKKSVKDGLLTISLIATSLLKELTE